MNQKSALITGIFGQDGYYLSKLLLSKDYGVFGLSHKKSRTPYFKEINLVYGFLERPDQIEKIISNHSFDEIYNLGGLSSVAKSWDNPQNYFEINSNGPLAILEAVRKHSPKTKFYQASSSEMFGDTRHSPQNELTPFQPRNPYAISKVAAHWITLRYREKYGLFSSSGILYNHESPHRPTEFVTRKITSTVAEIKNGKKVVLELGNIDSQRDWGFAGDYVEAMWEIVQQDSSEDFIIATGKLHSVREFVEEAFKVIGISLIWKMDSKTGSELGIDSSGNTLVQTSENLVRAVDSGKLCGDISKAKKNLGWSPKTSFEKLVRIMVEYDLKLN